ncbi:MAG: T9SS type A sorting domain-containing protein [Bacteroidetes bacterium]|nr:T9SS type A sorting domain-containing protein [Bacteroidota bacterium]
MKKVNFFFLAVIFLISSDLYSQSGWQWLNPIPQGNGIKKVQFFNDNIGYAVGRSNTVIKTTNGGANWVVVNNGIRALIGTGTDLWRGRLNSLEIIDENTVIAAGNGIIKTTNGGTTWFSIGGDVTSVTGVAFANSNTGFACTSLGKLYRTTNQGALWLLNGTFGTEIGDVYFASEQAGMFCAQISGNAVVYSTTNCGDYWSQAYTVSGFFIHHFDFVNQVTGYALADKYSLPAKLLKSTNGGVNWQLLRDLPFGTGSDNSFEMVSEQAGCIYTNVVNGTFRRTTNEGISWDSIPIRDVPTYGTFALAFNNTSTGFAMGTGGEIFYTSNSGSNWTCKSSQWGILPSLYYAKFFDENNGILLGAGNIIKTSNAGVNWNLYKANCNFYTGYFLNAQTGYSLAFDSLVKTTNGGVNWSLSGNGVFPNGLGSIYFFDESTGFVGDGLGKIFRTSNGGTNWSVQTLNTTTEYNSVGSIQFLDSQTGYLFNAHQQTCGLCPPTYTTVFKTVNAGLNWSSVASFSNVYFNRMKFISASLAYAVAVDGVYKYTGTWTKILNLPKSTMALDIVLPSTITVEGFRSTDSGLNWTPQDQQEEDVYDMYFVNQNTGYIVGYAGAILKTTNGGETISDIRNVNSNVPENYSLSQNYPNPFNPSTRINYELRNSNFILLKIFDLLGKEVATLVNEKQNAGSYAVDFNSTVFNLPSGIYFYTLNTGEFKETRKMILIK